ncbi:tRNA modification GTPase TrmE [Fistulina hepatica ATCC 64428]|uniref:tRNA modification GTPase TrmE n=1 Tax=Fistulina hepatica ATCC 64428 TaxID=1128425 RepID=A0A0D7A4N0_9AGAR|nr:tRNA modification GTPase TrmE [Fistulina hepatica ATCC 64428]
MHCLCRHGLTCVRARPYSTISALSTAQRKTIYALSTPPGKAGVGVIRVSGPAALAVWSRLIKAKNRKQDFPVPWKFERCHIVHPEDGRVIDDALSVFFKAPKSFTSEDVLELHVHSGRAIIASVFSALATFPSCRPAEAGEFTRRAFLGGRLDLTEVEGLRDLIDAETEGQRRLALRAASGSVRNQYEQIRSDIIHCLALVEALIDFSEEDVEDGVYDQARGQARRLLANIEALLDDGHRGEIIRSGIKLAIFGPPNAGKSTLLNFLAKREAAIVTSVPGTTRDILELSLDIDGLPVIVADTAGLRKSEDLVESIGIERARAAVQQADISLCVLSLESAAAGLPQDMQDLVSADTYFLFNKNDLAVDTQQHTSKPNSWTVSLATGDGTETFMTGLSAALQKRFQFKGDDDNAPIITHARHRSHLTSAAQFLRAFIEAEDVIFGAEELRYAAKEIGKISGEIGVEDVLDSIFRNFCIGK